MVSHDHSWFFMFKMKFGLGLSVITCWLLTFAKREIMPDGWKMLFFNLKMISIFFCRRSLFGSKDRLNFRLYDLLFKIV